MLMAAGCACEVTAASVSARLLAVSWLLAVLVRSQQPQCPTGQYQSHGCWLCLCRHSSLIASEDSGSLMAAGCACEVTAASVPPWLVYSAPC